MISTTQTLRRSTSSFDLSLLVLPLSNNPFRYKVEYDDSLDNTVVVDSVPIIDKSKLEKLFTKICKEFSKKGITIKADDIFMPWDDATGKSKGYAYISLYRLVNAAEIKITRKIHLC